MSGTLTRQRQQIHGHALPYLVGLDGLRALAVAAVVLYHADVAWLPGGFLGVDVFFVLSGFLITSLLLAETVRTGRIDFRAFYVRRARRLLPALLVVLAATAVLVATIAHDGAAAFRRDLPGAVLYVTNWSSIFAESSYFEVIGRPAFLKHLWSLALEEQFYLIWPVVALAAFRRGGVGLVGRVALIGAGLSTLLMLIWSVLGGMPTDHDPSRLYFGTDTHAMSVLLGAALATVWRPARTAPILHNQARTIVTGAGILGLLGLLLSFWMFHEYSTFLYRGGFLLVAGVTALVVAAATHRGSPLGSWLGAPPLRWIGQRSYGIYLWHWPIFLVTRPGLDIPFSGLPALAFRLALLALVAEASWRFVEMPVRTHGFSGAVAWGRSRAQLAHGPLRVAAIVGCALLIGFVGVRIAVAPSAQASGGFTAAQLSALVPVQAPLERDFYRLEQAEDHDPRPKVSAFGDSVLLGASPVLAEHLNLDLDARVAVQAEQVAGAIRSRAERGDLDELVLVHLGNNGRVTEEQIQAVLGQLTSARKVGLVTVRVPRSWQDVNNALFVKSAARYPNVVIVDWSRLAARNRNYLVADGVHLTNTGAQAYSRLVTDVLEISPVRAG